MFLYPVWLVFLVKQVGCKERNLLNFGYIARRSAKGDAVAICRLLAATLPRNSRFLSALQGRDICVPAHYFSVHKEAHLKQLYEAHLELVEPFCYCDIS